MIPAFINRRLNIQLPDTLEIIILCFIFAAEILGEINAYYVKYDFWDTMLHTMNGFLAAAIGFSLALVLFAGLRERLELEDVPAGMKGMPIALLTASILAMAFMGFSGLVR